MMEITEAMVEAARHVFVHHAIHHSHPMEAMRATIAAALAAAPDPWRPTAIPRECWHEDLGAMRQAAIKAVDVVEVHGADVTPMVGNRQISVFLTGNVVADIVDAALSAAIAAALAVAPDPWRPIETAPKDQIIDVWLGNGTPEEIAFYCDRGSRRSAGWRWEGDRFRPCGGLRVPVFVIPTHWMSPPPPPKESL